MFFGISFSSTCHGEGRVTDLHFMGLAPQAKFVPIDEQPDHNVMHLNRLGETDRLAHQPLDSGTPCGMLALDLLCISFARLGSSGAI
jgi:hypothetical protein